MLKANATTAMKIDEALAASISVAFSFYGYFVT